MLPATLPPAGLPGLDPRWSRLVTAAGATWHVLDRGPATTPEVTLLAVHGNPTWSYLWRRLVASAPPTWRVIAVDQLEMGFSERTGTARTLARRIDDLDALTAALGVNGHVVTVGHDWGGPVSLGWALRHRGRGAAGSRPAHPEASLAGVVLLNTAVHQPAGSRAPALIRAARLPGILPLVTERSSSFVRGAVGLSRGVPDDIAAAYRAPYVGAERRAGVRQFVADIPLDPAHPSAGALDALAADLVTLDAPALLLWGPRDPVFGDAHLRDLRTRLPHADIHRYEGAGHLLPEDAPRYAEDVIAWVRGVLRGDGDDAPGVVPARAAGMRGSVRIGAALAARAGDSGIAIADMGSGRRVSWATLAARTMEIAAGLVDLGVRPGQRIALAIPPGPDLIACVYAAWRIGAVVVVADSGLGIAGMRRAWRAAAPDHVIGIPVGLALARTVRFPGLRIRTSDPRGGVANAAVLPVASDATLVEVAARGRRRLADDSIAPVDRLGPEPGPDDEALVAFTSGATGPAKGVLYTHRRLCALRDALTTAYDIRAAGAQRDALVAAFAPWAVLGPALGIASAIPDMDIVDASTLTARAFADATAAVDGTLAWASPTALSAVVGTAAALEPAQRAALASLRRLLVAGAPVPLALLDRAAQLLPEATIATPYGMTEALPLTQVTRDELRGFDDSRGVLVGAPLDGVDVAIAPLDADGVPALGTVTTPGVTGEIVIRCEWMRERYDAAWATQHRAATPAGWHRTGDVGHLDESGRLVVEGRLAHLIVAPEGVVTPVGAEMLACRATGVERAAAVGVGPRGTQAVVIVLEAPGSTRSLRLADVETTLSVREALGARAGIAVAAVLVTPALPVDIRHRSKIDRIQVAEEASRLLAGSRSPDAEVPA